MSSKDYYASIISTIESITKSVAREASNMFEAFLTTLREIFGFPDDTPEAHLPYSYIRDHCYDWDAFCADVGLNPRILDEGLATGNELYIAKITVFQKHNVLK